METSAKGMAITKNIPSVNLMTTNCFANHQKRKLAQFLKQYSCIIDVTNCRECKFQKFILE